MMTFLLYSKKLCLAFSCLFFWQISFAQYSQNNIYNYKNTPLEEVLNDWSKTFDITFSYDYDLIKKQEVSQNFTHLSLKEKLIKLLRETNLEFKIISPKSIVFKKRSSSSFEKNKMEICGQVQDFTLRTPLPFVNIILENTNIGTTTDEQGNFSLKAPLVKDDVLVFSFLGYESKNLLPETLKKEPCLSVYLEINTKEMEEVIVRGISFENNEIALFSLSENSTANILNIEEVGDIGGLAEKDVMQTLQLLPGINGSDESASRLHIRGGTSGQNLVLFDNIPMYHFGHFFGKIASINPNMVEEVVVEKEGYSAQYGGRVAGVIDIRGKNTLPDSINFRIEGSLLSGNANLALPFAKKKMALFLSYRRSFTEFHDSPPFQKFFDQTFQNSRITEDESDIQLGNLDSLTTLTPTTSFTDFNAKLLWNPDAYNFLSVSFLHTKDNMIYRLDEVDYYNEKDNLTVSNSGLNVNWKHYWGANFTTQGSLSWSKYNNRFLFTDNLKRDSAATVRDNYNQLNDYSFQLINTLQGKEQKLGFGYHFTKINERASTFKRDSGTEDEHFDDNTTGISQAIFLDYHFDVIEKINFNFGKRLTHYNLTRKFYLEPRFAIKIYPVKKVTLKFAGGIYYQAINQIVETNKLNVEDHLWLLSRDEAEEGNPFSIVKNGQYSAGISYQKKGWLLDLGAYQKKFTGITSHILRFDATGFPFITGDMSAEGFETSL